MTSTPGLSFVPAYPGHRLPGYTALLWGAWFLALPQYRRLRRFTAPCCPLQAIFSPSGV